MIGVIIRSDDASKVRGRRKILEGMRFEARSGRMTGFVGPNGVDKSSSLRILFGLDRAMTGHATLDSRPCRELRNPLRHVGSMLGGAAVHPSRTARVHLGRVAVSNGIPRRRTQQVSEEVGLAADANRRVGAYSLGMGQRFGLATTLLGRPERLALDEPVNGLDPQRVRQICRLLRTHVDAGGTMLLSSYLIGGLTETASDVVTTSGGWIRVWDGAADVMAGHSSLEEAFFAHVEIWA